MDYGHEQTDEQLKILEKRIRSEYKQAASDVKKKLDRQLKAFDKEDRKRAKMLADGQITESEYLSWRSTQMLSSGRWQSMQQMLVKTYDEADKTARSLIRNTAYDAYALNFNFGTYEAEKGSKVDTAFTLYDRDTVRRLLKDNPDILPAPGKKVSEAIKRGELKRWNTQKVQSIALQGLLQGKSIPDISKDLSVRMGEMNMHSAIRAARTMTTEAENAGRLDSYRRAKEMGIDIKKRWLATLDGRTRHSHRQMDFEVRELEDPFSNGLMYPADPSGAPSEVYNCRCTLEADIPEYDTGDVQRKEGAGFKDYESWKNEHLKKADPRIDELNKKRAEILSLPLNRQALEMYQKGYMTKEEALAAMNDGTISDYVNRYYDQAIANLSINEGRAVVNGKDISDTWVRRKDEFDFEIEDVINAQGFDGLPKIVDADEFDRLVKEANGGNGFIAQRTYSAQSQEVLDNYRDELYNGHWYVDCSTGGAQYGQGMYCAADYTGKLSQGIKMEMGHYINLGKSRLQKPFSAEEQLQYAFNKIDSMSLSKKDKDNLKLALKFEYNYALPENKRAGFKETGIARDSLGDKVKYITDIKVEAGNQWHIAHNYVETLTLDKSAKIISFSDLRQKRSVFAEEYRNKAVEKATSKMSDIEKTAFRYTNGIESKEDRKTIEDLRWDDRSKYRDLMENRDKWQKEYSEISQKSDEYSTTMDDGTFATLLGYDAINAEGHGESGSYTVILNRTKVIIRRS